MPKENRWENFITVISNNFVKGYVTSNSPHLSTVTNMMMMII